MNGSEFLSTEINEVSYSDCSPDYYVFDNDSPYHPMINEQGEAICLLNEDHITADWSITKQCEPICSIREGGCDNGQTCTRPLEENIDRCLCGESYLGKYCEIIDYPGFFSVKITFFLKKNEMNNFVFTKDVKQ